MTIERAKAFLHDYSAPVRIMEVCGTHTSVVEKNGMRRMLSPHIRLLSGPGCPVCVTPADYIDAAIALSFQTNTCVLSFGDLFRVPGRDASFAQAKAKGGRFRMIYSPLEALPLAEADPKMQYVVAAVGFETTVPVYAVLLDALERRRIENVRLMTALKTMPAALAYLCEGEAADGFLCPGHVSAVIGSEVYTPICRRFKKPFAVTGFTPEHIMAAVCDLLIQVEKGEHSVHNLYASVVNPKGNAVAQALIDRYFTPADGVWRGIGPIACSALELRPEYAHYGVDGFRSQSAEVQPGCRCGDVMLGRIGPGECPLFGNRCRPENPVGACMVTGEGACGIWYGEREKDYDHSSGPRQRRSRDGATH